VAVAERQQPLFVIPQNAPAADSFCFLSLRGGKLPRQFPPNSRPPESALHTGGYLLFAQNEPSKLVQSAKKYAFS
jgi:hypothetical protein